MTTARVVLDHGVLVHGGARARVRPRELSPTMHRVLVHHGARPRARARPRESSPTMHRVLVHRGARPRARAPARVVPNYGARRLY